MPSKQSYDMVQHLLLLNEKKYLNTSEQLAYECGYLTGLIASLMDNDSMIYHAVKHEYKKAVDRHQNKS